MAGLKLEKHKEVSINSKIQYFKNPKEIRISLNGGIPLVEINDYVKKGMKVVKKEPWNSFICSSISGTVKDIKEKDYILIENDDREQELFLDIKPKYTKEECIEQIQNAGIIGLGGAGFPTFIKYKLENIHTLVINAVECEPYITADYMLSIYRSKEVIECIEMLMDFYKIKECFIGLKEHNRPLKEAFLKYIKRSNIHVVEVKDKYPMGWEKSLIRATKHVSYQKLPSEKNIVVNNVSTIYAIYEALTAGKTLTERIVTITGDIQNPCNVLVKNGTSLKELLEYLKIDSKEFQIIAGGPMMGKLVEEDFHLDSTINCLLFLKQNKYEKETTCLRCGKCASVCPVLLEPVLIRDSIKDLEILKKLNPSRCIECGLCSYICPASIPLRDKVKEAKQRVRKEK